jgi:hypothetical protein
MAFAVPVGNFVWVFLSVYLAWPEWWIYVNYEQSPLTWFSSVQLMLIGVVCGAIAHFQNRARDLWLWSGMGAAHFYFSLDERFQFHERMRDRFFKPHDIGTHIPGVGAGDFLFLIFAAAGLVVFYFLVRSMWKFRGPSLIFALGIVFALIAVISDAQPIQVNDLMAARTEQFWEEIFETLAQMSFLTSFVWYLRELCEEKYA